MGGFSGGARPGRRAVRDAVVAAERRATITIVYPPEQMRPDGRYLSAAVCCCARKGTPMSDPRNEENEFGEEDAVNIADANTEPDGDDDHEDPDMDEELNEYDSVPGVRQAPKLPSDTLAEGE
jgi:hypothetical protein